jgi:hypothetical protein
MSKPQSSAFGLGVGGQHVAAGTFRKSLSERERDATRTYKVVPLGERPADRPMAEHLGNGRNFSQSANHLHGSMKDLGNGPVFGMLKRPNDPTHFRKAKVLAPSGDYVMSAAPKLMSWEQD